MTGPLPSVKALCRQENDMKLTPTQRKALIAGGMHEHQDVHASLRTLWSLHRLGLVRVPTTGYRGASRGWAALTDDGKEVIIALARKAFVRLRAEEDARRSAVPDLTAHLEAP